MKATRGFCCVLCPVAFQSPQGLEMHVKFQHPALRVSLPCQIRDEEGTECGYPTLDWIRLYYGGHGGQGWVMVPCCKEGEGHMAKKAEMAL